MPVIAFEDDLAAALAVALQTRFSARSNRRIKLLKPCDAAPEEGPKFSVLRRGESHDG